MFVVDGTRMDATSYYDQTILTSEIEKVYVLENKNDFMRYYYDPTYRNPKESLLKDMESQNKEDEKREQEQRDRNKINEGGVANGKDFNSLPGIYPIVFPSYNRLFVIIYLQTYEKGMKHREPIGVRKTNVMGFSTPRAFYNPNYKEYVLPDEQDYRRTLYWNPDIETNSLGKVSVEFYNNSSCKKMNVSAETITGGGISGFYHMEQ